jgi:hypothetical protein
MGGFLLSRYPPQNYLTYARSVAFSATPIPVGRYPNPDQLGYAVWEKLFCNAI